MTLSILFSRNEDARAQLQDVLLRLHGRCLAYGIKQGMSRAEVKQILANERITKIGGTIGESYTYYADYGLTVWYGLGSTSKVSVKEVTFQPLWPRLRRVILICHGSLLKKPKSRMRGHE
jgi:hypothetical protein